MVLNNEENYLHHTMMSSFTWLKWYEMPPIIFTRLYIYITIIIITVIIMIILIIYTTWECRSLYFFILFLACQHPHLHLHSSSMSNVLITTSSYSVSNAFSSIILYSFCSYTFILLSHIPTLLFPSLPSVNFQCSAIVFLALILIVVFLSLLL